MLTLTRHAGTGGLIKQLPEDFVVKEITSKGIVLQPGTIYDAKTLQVEEPQDGKHLSFVLQKKNWNTIDALLAIAKKLGHGRKSVGYAGSKDKKAVSVQLASVFHPTNMDLRSIQVKDVSINGFWRSNGVELGDDLGNAFEVKVREVSHADNAAHITAELDGKMPNYYGEQRFGERRNNAIIGAAILQGRLEEAILEYLTNASNEKNEDVNSARNELKNTLDYVHALETFPKFLRGERTVLSYLSKYPKNYANALKLLPRGIALIFIHAVQAQIFNEELEQRIKSEDFKSALNAGSNFYGFPQTETRSTNGIFPLAVLVGFETPESEISAYAKESMEKMQLKPQDFKINSVPELSMRGEYRTLIAPVKDISHRSDGDTFSLSFSLPKGSYATVLLDEFIKAE